MKEVTKIRASSLDRAMKCAAFLRLETLEFEQTDVAKEGEAAGELLMYKVAGTKVPQKAKNGLYFDTEMEYWSDKMKIHIPVSAQAEVKCGWQTRSGIWITGRYDFSWISDDSRILYVDDYKYGYGLIEVERKWQLIAYAIGEVIRRGKAFEKITMRIIQPRPHHDDGPVRAWTITYEELLDLKEEIEARCLKIVEGFSEAATSKECKWCVGTAEQCAAFNHAFYNAIDFVHKDFVRDSLTEQDISSQLDLIKRAADVIKIRSEGLTELARVRCREGKVIPNYVLKDKYGHNVWKDGMTAEFIKQFSGFDIMEKVPMSPAQAAKELKMPEMLITSMTKRPFRGVTLVKKDAAKDAEKTFAEINNKKP